MSTEVTEEVFDSLPPKTWDVAGWLPNGDWKTVRIDPADAKRLISEIISTVKTVVDPWINNNTWICGCGTRHLFGTKCGKCRWEHVILPNMRVSTSVGC